jgi:hypothetical protein
MKYLLLPFNEGVEELLEGYNNPQDQLSIEISEIEVDYDTHYIKAIVSEKNTNENILRIDYSIGDGEVDVGNVKLYKSDKSDYGFDDGHAAIRWIFNELLVDSKNRGFKSYEIISKSRYTGSRAVNSPNKNNPLQLFDVKLKLKETYFSYSLEGGFLINPDNIPKMFDVSLKLKK